MVPAIKQHPDIEQWALTIRKETTRQLYSHNLDRLLKTANLTPNDVVRSVKDEWAKADASTYARLVRLAQSQFKQATAYAMICGLRKYLLDHGLVALPKLTVQNPDRVKDKPDLSWSQALRIANAASQPYASIFRLMLENGWGNREFLQFNSAETWAAIKRASPAEYYRHDFKGRKRNQQPNFSLIRMDTLREITAAVPVPFTIRNGEVLDYGRGWRKHARYLQNSWKTAYRRSGIKLRQGTPTPHSLRSAFRTRAAEVGCDPTVAEFFLKHTIDSLGYNRLYNNVGYLWQEIQKVFGPVAATQEQIENATAPIRQITEQLLKESLENLSREISEIETTTEDDIPEARKMLLADLRSKLTEKKKQLVALTGQT